MTPFYLIPPNPPFSLEEPNEDQVQLQLFTPPSQVSSSTLSFPLLFSPIQDQVGNYDREQQEQIQPQAKKFDLHGGSNDHQFFPTDSLPTMENNSGNTHKFSICEQQDRDEHRSDHGSIKWMSSKMRLMKKMMNSREDKPVKIKQKLQDQKKPSSIFDAGINSKNSSNYSNNSIIRTCSDCNTTKTPLWRSGPRGPKSLCNACGIRQRKARRAMAVAASDAVLTSNTSSMSSKVHQKEKKRCKLAPPVPHGRKKICFEDFFLSLSENSAFHQVFPQDEKDAAILLMALSCGLVHG